MKVRADKNWKKKLENISKLADDIVLTEQNERKLFIAYKKRIESQRRKKSSYEEDIIV